MAITINGQKVAGIGMPGKDGKSPYQVAKENGYSGTEAEFNDRLGNLDDMVVSEAEMEIDDDGVVRLVHQLSEVNPDGNGLDGYATESFVEEKIGAITPESIEAAPSTHGNHVPTTESANNARFLRNDNTWQTVTPGNIGASATGHKHTKLEITDFPTSMTPTAHNQAASTITAGTFAGQVVANASGQAYNASVLRNSKLVSAETNPTVNGEICWTYE